MNIASRTPPWVKADFDNITQRKKMGIDYLALRETAGMSVEDFARDLAVEPETVKAWEAGRAAPDVITQKKIFALVKKMAESGQ